jgi:hypothetical protein
MYLVCLIKVRFLFLLAVLFAILILAIIDKVMNLENVEKLKFCLFS